MELDCSVLLNAGVSFAPTPSTPPRLREAPSCRQQHHLKFPEDVSKGYSVLWKDRKPDSEELPETFAF